MIPLSRKLPYVRSKDSLVKPFIISQWPGYSPWDLHYVSSLPHFSGTALQLTCLSVNYWIVYSIPNFGFGRHLVKTLKLPILLFRLLNSFSAFLKVIPWEVFHDCRYCFVSSQRSFLLTPVILRILMRLECILDCWWVLYISVFQDLTVMKYWYLLTKNGLKAECNLWFDPY